MNLQQTEVFVEQPLASPASANHNNSFSYKIMYSHSNSHSYGIAKLLIKAVAESKTISKARAVGKIEDNVIPEDWTRLNVANQGLVGHSQWQIMCQRECT